MKSSKISVLLNLIIVILVILGSIFMFTGFKFMPSTLNLSNSKIEMFEYFTVDSNILMGIVSLIFIININKKNRFISILKLMGTSSVTLTFLTTLFFLAPQYDLYSMYNNTNLFFHLIVPLLAIISYIFFEKNEIKYKEAIYGIIPMFLYSIFYAGNIFLHLNNGEFIKYDFYGFLNGNINNIYIVIPIIYLITYLISLSLVFLNKKKV